MIYVNWLNHVNGFGRRKLEAVCTIYGSGREIWELGDRERKNKWRSHVQEKGKCALKERDLCLIEQFKSVVTPQKLWQDIINKGIRVIDTQDSAYPARLLDIPDRPALLYMIGGNAYEPREGAGQNRPTVAVVGSRVCSEYGRMIAGRIGRLCAMLGIELISGMAVGIDGIAQRAALEAGGDSTAVLGSGVDICYPRENEELYVNLKQKGRIISEYVPGMLPKPGNFPLRNRIISGLADALIVVEAKEKSGTMISVDMALEQGRDVYIIPGRLSDPLSVGCNRLISQGAEIIWNLTDTLEGIAGKKRQETLRGLAEEGQNAGPDPESPEASVYSVLDFYPRTLQSIYEEASKLSGVSFECVQTCLLELEMSGAVAQEGGRYFIRGKA